MFDSLRYKIADWLLPKNRYEGAWPSVDQPWIPTGLQPARIDPSPWDRRSLQKHSEYWEKNSPLYTRMCDLFETYTVGTGLVLQPDSSSPEFNRAAKDYWGTWSREPDLGSRQPFGTLQTMIARAWMIYGEEFVPLVIDDEGNPRIQLIEARQIKTPDGMVDSPTLADGVALDRYGKPTGYYVEGQADPVPAASMVHIFEPRRSGQVRGLPFIYSALKGLNSLETTEDLIQQCVKNDATLWSIIKTQTGELTPAMMRAARFGVVKPPPSGTPGAACASPDAGTYYQQVFGATAKVLRTGDSWESYSSDRPSTNAQEFMRDRAEKIAAGTGFPLVLVLPESLQGTVARGTYEMANAYFRACSLVLANGITSIYEFVLSAARNKVPALRDPPADWRKVTIRPPRSVNVDPGRRSTAAINELKAGVTNYEILYGELGLDWKEEFAKLKEQQDYAREIGLTLEMPGLEALAPEPNPDDPEEKPKPKKEEEDEEETAPSETQ